MLGVTTCSTPEIAKFLSFIQGHFLISTQLDNSNDTRFYCAKMYGVIIPMICR
jgi:hypothetical protein